MFGANITMGVVSRLLSGLRDLSLALLLVMLVFAIALPALLPSAAVAQEDSDAGKDRCAAPNLQTDLRPDADGPPTKVTIGMQMIDLMKVDDISQTLTGDFAVVLTWTDPRLAHLKGCEILLQDIWEPGITILNSGRKYLNLPIEAEIGPAVRLRIFKGMGGRSQPITIFKTFLSTSRIFKSG